MDSGNPISRDWLLAHTAGHGKPLSACSTSAATVSVNVAMK